MKKIRVMTISIKHILFLIALILVFSSCNDDSDIISRLKKSETELAKEEFYEIMGNYYLWNYNMPNVNIDNYATPESLLEVLRNDDPYDRWSFIISATEFDQYFTRGEVVDHGIGLKMDAQEEVRVSYIYKNAPLYTQGVRRGWKVLRINGKVPWEYSNYYDMWGPDEAGISNTFEFENLEGQEVTLTVVKTLYVVNTVVHSEIFEVNAKKVGYLVFDSFIDTSEEELEEAFLEFKNQGVEEFILDLRYNPGGDMDITTQLASLLTGFSNDKVLITFEHNPDNSSENYSENFESQANSLELNRIFIITSNRSASASEVIINGLKSYISVIVIGDDTSGKPVGMYVFINEDYDYAYVPICYELKNKDGIGGYYDGIKADAYVYDDVTAPWGSQEEDCVSEALYYIANGNFSSKSMKEFKKSSFLQIPELVGLKNIPTFIKNN